MHMLTKYTDEDFLLNIYLFRRASLSLTSLTGLSSEFNYSHFARLCSTGKFVVTVDVHARTISSRAPQPTWPRSNGSCSRRPRSIWWPRPRLQDLLQPWALAELLEQLRRLLEERCRTLRSRRQRGAKMVMALSRHRPQKWAQDIDKVTMIADARSRSTLGYLKDSSRNKYVFSTGHNSILDHEAYAPIWRFRQCRRWQ